MSAPEGTTPTHACEHECPEGDCERLCCACAEAAYAGVRGLVPRLFALAAANERQQAEISAFKARWDAAMSALAAKVAILRKAIEPGTAAGRMEAALDDAERLGFVPGFSSGPDGDPIHFLVTQAEQAVALREALAEALPLIPPDAPLRWYENDKVRDKIKKALAAPVAPGMCQNYREHGLVCGRPAGHAGDCGSGPAGEAPRG